MIQSVSRQRGQGMTEYIIVVALIAVGAIAVYQGFGNVVRTQTAAMAHELAGKNGTTLSTAAGAAAVAGAKRADGRTLNSFTGNSVTSTNKKKGSTASTDSTAAGG